MTARPSLSFVTSDTEEAINAARHLRARYGEVAPEKADIIIALGGDGLMLSCLHRFMGASKPIYGMNRGSVGFLMNDYAEDGLYERLHAAERSVVYPLLMTVTDLDGQQH